MEFDLYLTLWKLQEVGSASHLPIYVAPYHIKQD